MCKFYLFPSNSSLCYNTIMREYKAKYPHDRAKEVLNNIGAIFLEKKEHDDFYLKTKNGDIFKFKREGENVYLVGLDQVEDGFDLVVSEFLNKEVADILLPLFKNNPLVLKKNREVYSWKGSRIMLDNVQKIGEYLEFYPVNDEARVEIMDNFGLRTSDLIIKSYFDL